MVVIKHRYIPGRRKQSQGGNVVSIGKALAHVNYIQHRPGEDREPGGREMFNEHGDQIDAKEMRKAIRELGDSRVVVHKLTLAPEINPQDKKAFTREVMQKLGQDMGRDLQWFGVEHNNTDHHHIHVVVLGRDSNGTEVRIGLKDIDKARDHGERYLERCHPHELERARRERRERERERLAERTREKELAREERIHDGLELPWMHRKVIREQLEPYKEWRKKQDARERDERKPREEQERPFHQDTIEATGKEWSKANTLKELRDLDERLWDNYDERIEKDKYIKLKAWIHEKERAERDRQPEGKESKKSKDKKHCDELEYDGKKYSKGDSYEKLTGLNKELRDKSEKLPYDDYRNLRSWIEDKDRERFSGAISKEMDRVIEKTERSKTMEDLKSQEGGRVLNPVQQQVMSTPLIGLWMQYASFANQMVRSIVLDDRNRDYTKEQRDGLEDSKKALGEHEKDRSSKGLKMPWEDFDNMLGSRYSRSEYDRNKELEQRENIDKAIDKNKEKRDKEIEKEAEKKKEKDRSPFERDPWGRW